eukprot:CAMPEP_0179992076 /NCGR_PEP_ID=MMETSP0984-20121128/5326_1 /TAXON_ID=483367 /ORGANISM="non described non described, Strain CCMP 2436" /LENGTH=66 /DNA_ID=CAMNT_0021911411 /DNA_START=150 /DNA_END=347 /DNA_ORIENTATION=+
MSLTRQTGYGDACGEAAAAQGGLPRPDSSARRAARPPNEGLVGSARLLPAAPRRGEPVRGPLCQAL